MLLQKGDVFPSLTFARVGGGEMHSPGDLAGGFGMIPFHRAFWCGFCDAQLTAFARAADKFGGEDIKIVPVSVDDREEALVGKRRRGSPVAYGADARAVSAFTGAFVVDAPVDLQATGFVLIPEGPIVTAAYSIGAIGPLMHDDVLGLVRTSYLRQRTEERWQIGGEVDEWRSRL